MEKLCNSKKPSRISLPLVILHTLIFTLFAVQVYAVSEAAVLFLLISPSPQANAMGQTYGNITNHDPFATVMNPASLGFFAQKNYIGTSFYLEKISWLPELTSGITYNCYSTNVGINLKEINGLPLSFGIGYNHVLLDMGKKIITGEGSPEPLGEFESWDKANSFTFAAALDYHIRTSFGYSYKFINSKLSPEEVKVNAYDLGFIMQIPVVNLVRNFNIIPTEILSDVRPFFTPGFYYSICNVGDKIVYIDTTQADPLPRNVSIGVNLNTGFKYIGKHHSFDLFSFKWTREADDLLIQVNPDGTTEYVSGLKDINFIDNILLGKSNEKVITKKGWEFGIGDVYFIRHGRYEDIEGKVLLKTEGWGVNFIQILKIINELIPFDTNNFFTKLLLNLDIEYNYSKYQANQSSFFNSMKFKGFVIKLNNFPLNF